MRRYNFIVRKQASVIFRYGVVRIGSSRDFWFNDMMIHMFGYIWNHRRYMDLCVSGESNKPGIGPLTLPPRARGVCPVQKTQTYTAGMLLSRSPTHCICSQFLQLSHNIMGRPSSVPLHTQRVDSLDRLLRSVDGVFSVESEVYAGEALNELVNGSNGAGCVRSAEA